MGRYLPADRHARRNITAGLMYILCGRLAGFILQLRRQPMTSRKNTATTARWNRECWAAEVADRSGRILAATGKDGRGEISGLPAGEFRYTELDYRRSNVETMSHSRGIIEWYELKEDSARWMFGDSSFEWKAPAVLDEEIAFLPRRAPYASLSPDPGGVFHRSL